MIFWVGSPSSLALTGNTWTQVAGSSIQNQLILFINGQKVAVQSTSVDFGTSEKKLLLGGEANGAYLLGLLDDVRIYDRALYELGGAIRAGEWVGHDYGGQWHGGGWIDRAKQAVLGSKQCLETCGGWATKLSGGIVLLDVDVDGANLSYQWKKDGVDITGATSPHSFDYRP